MSLALKSVSGVLGLSGGCCLVSAPLVMNDIGTEQLSSESSKNSQISTVSIEICKDSENAQKTKISFGESNINQVCGTSEGNGELDNGISSLFKAAGGKNEVGAKLGVDNLRAFCRPKNSSTVESSDESPSGFDLWSNKDNCDGVEYLALGNNNTFVKKGEIIENNDSNIWICTNNCGKNSTVQFELNKAQQVVEESEQAWKKVEFYEKRLPDH